MYKCPHHTFDTDRPYTEDSFFCATCGDLISVKTGEPVIVENTVNVPKPRFLADDYEAIRNRLREIKGEPHPVVIAEPVKIVTDCHFFDKLISHKCNEASCAWRDTIPSTKYTLCGKGYY
jgi:hypothetical protein